jgi:hypothetical protein
MISVIFMNQLCGPTLFKHVLEKLGETGAVPQGNEVQTLLSQKSRNVTLSPKTSEPEVDTNLDV